MFDIVIPVGPNDVSVIKNHIQYTKTNVIGYRNIYLVSSLDTLQVDECITITENIFPFKMNDIEEMFGKHSRNGWYLQQLLKFYAGNIIPGILSRYLVIDADTIFVKPTSFITGDGKCIYTTGQEYHEPYFHHMNRLYPYLKKLHPLSGISHHTLFETNRVNEIFKLVESYHNNKPFWKIYLDEIDKSQYLGSGAAENEIYFTYIYLHYSHEIYIRELKWANLSNIDFDLINLNNLDFVSIHWYLRP